MSVLPTFHFPQGTLISFDSHALVVSGFCRDGLIVWDRALEQQTAQHFVLEHAKVREIMGRLDTVVDETFGSDGPEEAALAAQERASISAWESATDEERYEAQLKEAWCLASQKVLQGARKTETNITRRFDAIQADAFRRQRLLKRGTDRNGAFQAKTWGPKRVSQFCTMYFGQLRPSPEALLNKKASGNKTTPRMSAEASLLLDRICKKYCSTAQPSKASIERTVKQAFRRESAERMSNGRPPLTCPHRNTIYRRLAQFTKFELVVGRAGIQEAMKEFSPTQHGVRALKPGELIELDFWHGDVFTLRQKSDFWGLLSPDLQEKLEQKVKNKKTKKKKKKKAQRLWVCAAIDVATRMILGIGVAETANVRTVIEVLDMTTRDKSQYSQLAGCSMAWSQATGIGTVVVDTGNEFFDAQVQAAIVGLGGSYIYGRTGVPMDKPFVERFFRTLRMMFADELPGKTGYSPDCLIAYDKEGMAAFDADVFRHLLVRFCVDYYPLQEHMGLMGKRPVDQWKDAMKYGAVGAPSVRVRRRATGLKLSRKLTKEGVRILGVPFGEQSQFPKKLWEAGVDLEIRLDPTDMREVTALHEGKIYHLENQRPDLAHHTVRTLMAAIEKMRATKPQDKKFYEYVLAKHASWIDEKIQSGIEAHGLPSTELKEETLEWFENSHCVRLQIEKNPAESISADMDTLLSGGQGRGIYSPEMIEAEKRSRADKEASEPLGEGAEPCTTTAPTNDTSAPPDVGSDRAARQSVGTGTNKKSKGKTKAPGKTFSGAPKGRGSFK
ncbi:DDE-type integrase/transposase/recombinase [Celeribacter halophilus]|uniref:Integrase core domain-containing protein n=1 Tax=Celeribacter halophilus TaxID=576117 RepID=A0A1I3W0P1_9RHOB|nr:DDE-type integrase/transposase/recombinase [Celeribacter halophilus]PZX06851.1 integrase-like protein [Celeribacter halophilus]SFK01174.1 Integrase core domain-containing protein [Celeribacter halophilus]